MSSNASVMFRQQYVDRVSAIYQQKGGRLQGMTSRPVRFEGSSKAIFYAAGKSKGYETTGPRQQNVPSGQGITPLEVSLRTFTVYDEVHEWDEDRMSVDEREVIYNSGANAMGRLSDNVIMVEGYTAKTAVASNCDFSAGAFGVVGATNINLALQQAHVQWDGNIFCPLPAQAWNEFILNKLVNSADHVNRDDLPFMKATDSRFWNGVNYFLYEPESEDRESFFPSATNNGGGAGKEDTLAWHLSALGWAPHTGSAEPDGESQLKVSTQWHNEIDTLSINMKLKGAPKALQPSGAGIIRVRLRSSGTLAVV